MEIRVSGTSRTQERPRTSVARGFGSFFPFSCRSGLGEEGQPRSAASCWALSLASFQGRSALCSFCPRGLARAGLLAPSPVDTASLAFLPSLRAWPLSEALTSRIPCSASSSLVLSPPDRPQHSPPGIRVLPCSELLETRRPVCSRGSSRAAGGVSCDLLFASPVCPLCACTSARLLPGALPSVEGLPLAFLQSITGGAAARPA